MKKTLAILGLGASSLVSGAAMAIPVEYNGALFDFNVIAGAPNTYTINYTADFTHWLGGGQTNIGGIQFSVGGNPITAFSLISTPLGNTGWTAYANQNLSASGCGGGAVGGLCAQDSSGFLSTTYAGIYTWSFSVTYTNALPLNFNDINTGNPIRMWFVDSSGRNRGLMSCVTGNANGECGTAVPEPSTLALLGLGLLGIGVSRRRRA